MYPAPGEAQKSYGISDVLRRSQTFQGDGINIGGADVIGQAGGHIGFHETGGDRVDGDVTTGQLLGRGLGQADEAALAEA